MDPQDEVYRRILEAGQGYKDADMQAPLYLRTTNEMLKEFDYLTPEKAYEIVVTNTQKVADWCDRISPISDEKCPPHIEGCEQEIQRFYGVLLHQRPDRSRLCHAVPDIQDDVERKSLEYALGRDSSVHRMERTAVHFHSGQCV